MSDAKTTCCPKFAPELWDGKTLVWKDKLFVQDNVRQIFHIPLNMGKVITRMWAGIEKAGAAVPAAEFVMLACDPSPWTSELYMSVSRAVPGAKMVALSGTFLCKVFDGPYNAVPRWMKDMERYAAASGKKALKQYFYFTTCPRCMKIYGHNYVVAFAQVE